MIGPINKLLATPEEWAEIFEPIVPPWNPPPISIELHRTDILPLDVGNAYRAEDVIRVRVMATARGANLAHLTFPG